MTKDYKMFDWTNVNQESNKKLMDDLMMDLGLLTPKGVLMVMPDKLSESLIAVSNRLEFYQSWIEQCRRLEHLKPYTPIAHVVYKDGTIMTVDVHEEGHSYVEDIYGHLQSDIADEEEFTKLQCGTVIKLRKVVKVINPENGEEFIIDQNPNSPKVAFIVDNTRSIQLIEYENDFDSVESVARYIEKAIANGKDTIENTAHDGKRYTTNISKAWKVTTSDHKQEWIVNEENQALEQPTLKEMNHIQLKNWISTFSEQVVFAIDDDDMDEELESCIEILDEAIDELAERYVEANFNVNRLDDILSGFIKNYDLYEQFNDYIDQIKLYIHDPKDTYEVAKEMYGEDLADFIKQRPWLVGK